MKSRCLLLLLSVAACQQRESRSAASGATDSLSAYDAVARGSSCSQFDAGQSGTQLNCEYTVGAGLKFDIAGVGEPDAGITVTHADGLDADYYFTYGVGHGCVIVKHGQGKIDMAFVSPKNGRVYHTWAECGSAK